MSAKSSRVKNAIAVLANGIDATKCNDRAASDTQDESKKSWTARHAQLMKVRAAAQAAVTKLLAQWAVDKVASLTTADELTDFRNDAICAEAIIINTKKDGEIGDAKSVLKHVLRAFDAADKEATDSTSGCATEIPGSVASLPIGLRTLSTKGASGTLMA